MNKPSKSKAETESERHERLAKWYNSIRSENGGRLKSSSIPLGSFPSLLRSSENERRLQLEDTPPESERQILRCAPQFDAQAEHEKDLEYESRVDYASWETEQESE